KALGRPVVVFNFGFGGAGPFQELLTLRRLLADAGRPDLVLVEVLPPALADRGGPSGEPTELKPPTARLPPNELRLVRRYANGARPGLRRGWWAAWAVPCYTHRVDILRAVFPALLHGDERIMPLHTDASGWFPFDVGEVTADVRCQRTRQEWAAY